MLCDEVLDHFEKIIGEPVFPHMYLYNAAQMNVGKIGADGPVDQWHFDSVNYVAVTLLSDITDMKVKFCQTKIPQNLTSNDPGLTVN